MSLKKLKGFLIKEEELSPEPAPKAVPIQQTVTPVVEIDETYVNLLDDLLDKRDMPGPDFLEFYKTLKQYENQPVPEVNKYQMAFIPHQISGLTKEKIVESSATYLQALTDESTEFEKQLNSKKITAVVNKRSNIEALTKENSDLQKKIQENNESIIRMNAEAMQAESDLNLKSQKFKNAVASAVGKIQEIVSKTQNYIQ